MKKEKVIFETNKGTIVVELNKQKAPITVENFLKYVEGGFYDGTIFHRVIPDFMIQGGGFTMDGKQKPTDEPIKLESGNGLLNKKLSVAMARTNVPDSATAQFFINVKDNGFLDKSPGNDGYAVFGKVIEGEEVVMKIVDVPTTTKDGHSDWPIEDVIITRAYLKWVGN